MRPAGCISLALELLCSPDQNGSSECGAKRLLGKSSVINIGAPFAWLKRASLCGYDRGVSGRRPGSKGRKGQHPFPTSHPSRLTAGGGDSLHRSGVIDEQALRLIPIL